MMDYAPPLDKFLRLGAPQRDILEPPSYARFGVGPEHVSELIRMATDVELNTAMSDSIEVWAPIHAWRALAEIQPVAALDALLSIRKVVLEETDSDWETEDTISLAEKMGGAAVPSLERYLADETMGAARDIAADALGVIGESHPEERRHCVEILSHALERFEHNEDPVNGMIVASLVRLRATEAVPVMERAFAACKVDETLTGGWEWVQYDLGLRDEPMSHRYKAFAPLAKLLAVTSGFDDRKSHQALRAKRKSQRQAKKKNRNRRR